MSTKKAVESVSKISAAAKIGVSVANIEVLLRQKKLSSDNVDGETKVTVNSIHKYTGLQLGRQDRKNERKKRGRPAKKIEEDIARVPTEREETNSEVMMTLSAAAVHLGVSVDRVRELVCEGTLVGKASQYTLGLAVSEGDVLALQTAGIPILSEEEFAEKVDTGAVPAKSRKMIEMEIEGLKSRVVELLTKLDIYESMQKFERRV